MKATSRFERIKVGDFAPRLAVVWLACSMAPAMAQNADPDAAGKAPIARPGSTDSSAIRSKPAPRGPSRVVVLPFTGEDMDPGKLSDATDRFRSKLSSSDSFWIAPARKVAELVRRHRSEDSSECLTGDCSLEIGRQLGAQSVFTGAVSQEVETWRLEVVRTDVATGKILFDHLIEIYGSFDDLVSQGCPRMARLASGRESSDNNYTVLDGTGGGHAWPWIVGGIAAVAGGATAAVLLLQDKGSPPASPSTTPDRLIVKW